LDEDGNIAEEEYMDEHEAKRYRSVGARMNYLALDRTDVQQACRCICAHMSKPLKECEKLVKRTARYLKGRPRCVQKFLFEGMSHRLVAFADSDWAGCQLTRKSTSGGVLMLGSSLLKSWSSVQSTVAMSSGEADLYAMVNAASYVKYVMSIARDFGMNLNGLVRTDSTAALGMTQRSGLGGRTRHIQVQYLWLQESVCKKELGLSKVASEDNLADILTKCVPNEFFNKHLQRMNFSFPADITSMQYP